MKWLQVTLECPRAWGERIAYLLEAFGARSTILQGLDQADISEFDPQHKTLNPYIKVSGLFPPHFNASTVHSRLKTHLPKHLLRHFYAENLPDKDWEHDSEDIFHPVQCGDKLWICPAWQTPPDPSACNIILNQGFAFGTGFHPTTYLCLQWLNEQPLAGKTILDFGCGSGILALTAAKLGAEKVDAIDNDPQAIQATQQNIDLNRQVAAVINACKPETLDPHSQYDIVLANIVTSTLIDLANSLVQHVKIGGRLLLSGIMSHERDRILDCFQPLLELYAINELDGWLVFEFRKSNAT